MKLIRNILVFAAACLFAFSCTEKEEPIVESFLKLSQTTIEAGSEGGEFSVTVNSSEDWKVAGLCDWVTLSTETGKDGDKLVLTVAPNHDVQPLSAEFKVFAGSAVEKLTITSGAVEHFMKIVSEKEISFSAVSNTVNVQVATDFSELEVSLPAGADEWLSYSETREGVGVKVITFSATANELYTDRTAKVRISANGLEDSFELTQAKKDVVLTEEPVVVFKGLDSGSVQVKVRSNVALSANPSDEWLVAGKIEKGATGADGLTDYTFNFAFDKSEATRMVDVNFTAPYLTIDKQYLTVVVRQQNPNPVMGKFEDAGLRGALVQAGWILEVDGVDCEVLLPGLTEEFLELGSEMSYERLAASHVAGLSAFPKLKKIRLYNIDVKNLDLSDCKNIEEVTLDNTPMIHDIALGSNPVKSLVLNTGTFGISWPETPDQNITVTGEKLESIWAHSEDYGLAWSEKIEYLDVSGCPALKDLDAYRYVNFYGYEYSLPILYVSAAQKAAIDAKDIKLVIASGTKIVVR